MAETPKKTKAQPSNVYTALLGLAALALAVTAGVACYYAQTLHESIFALTS